MATVELMNRAMAEKIRKGEARDVSPYIQPDGTYALPARFFVEDIDYCDASSEEWVWSIGKFADGSIHAALDGRFYQVEGIECLWLR